MRLSDVPYAFQQAVRIAPSGKRTVRVFDFVRELARINCEWSPTVANDWIKRYEVTWRLCDEDENGNHQYYKFNSNQ